MGRTVAGRWVHPPSVDKGMHRPCVARYDLSLSYGRPGRVPPLNNTLPHRNPKCTFKTELWINNVRRPFHGDTLIYIKWT